MLDAPISRAGSRALGGDRGGNNADVCTELVELDSARPAPGGTEMIGHDELHGTVIQVVRLTRGPAEGVPIHGRIRGDNGMSYFLHPSEVEAGDVNLHDRVLFVAGHAPRGPRALRVRLIRKYEPPPEGFSD